MKKPAIVITLVTLYLLFFKVSPHIVIPDEMIIVMLILPPFIITYMVFVALKYRKSSKFRFEEKFYEGHESKRNE